MSTEEEKIVQKESHIDNFDIWLARKLIEDREILDALGSE